MYLDHQDFSLTEGSLCVANFPFDVMNIEEGETKAYVVYPGEIFMLLEALEIDELGVIEIQILFQNEKMWFNIHKNNCNIDHVRRAESYDIPFMTLQAAESGSSSHFD